MRVLFVHQNFPGQFAAAAAALASKAGNEVVAIGCTFARDVPGVRVIRYAFGLDDIGRTHPYARRLDAESRRAEQIIYIGSELIAAGFIPDVVFVHCGWGEAIPLRTLFPAARIVTYVEWFYRGQGTDVDFDPEWPAMGLDSHVGLRVKNAATLLALTEADVAVTPTAWQRSTFPEVFRSGIQVCHEGVDLDRVQPDPAATLELPSGLRIAAGDEVVTYVSRNLEPLRGYHTFMRSLPRLLARRPAAQVVIVGGDDSSYGLDPPKGLTWKRVFLDEVRPGIDASRVHFLGRVDYGHFLRVLQVSAVHVYLTYPFVLSWSMLEAMAAECLVLGSSTGPVVEVIDGTNGVLVDFFDAEALADQISAALEAPSRFQELRRNARRTVASRFDRADCLDRLFAIAEDTDAGRDAP